MSTAESTSDVLDHRRKIDQFLESMVVESQQMGEELYRAFEKKITQIRGLERLIVSTTRFSEIRNYVKNQAGRETGSSKPWKLVAEALLRQLAKLEGKAIEIGGADNGAVMDAKLRLARGWGRQVVAHYLYTAARKGAGG
jgi:hypothetical protein